VYLCGAADAQVHGGPVLRHTAALVLRLATLAVCALGIAACQGCRSSSTPVSAPPAGTDIGPPTLRLYLLTDLAGALEPCGCTKDQLGGIGHLGAWIRQSGAAAPTSLVASAGPLFFMDPSLESERADQDRAKADAIARVLHALGFAAFAPGTNDWADGSAGLAELANAAEAPAIVPARPPGAPSPPFVSVSVRDAGPLKVGFVGYGQPGATPSPPGADVENAVKQGVDEAKRQGANVLIALAAVGRGEAKRIADANPDLTAVLVGSAKSSGDANTTSPQGERVGDVLIAQAANHLQSVAVLDLYVREPVAAGHVVKFADATGLELAQQRDDIARRIDDLHDKISAWEREKSVSAADLRARRQDLANLEAQRDKLDEKAPPAQGSFFRYAMKEIRESLGDDPATLADMVSYYKAVNDHNRVAFAERVPALAGPEQASYVGIDVCSSCHPAARAVWDATSHAKAYATLSSQFKEFNLECVGCHVTGYDRPGGSTVTHVKGLQDVQCEVCHGPGSKHAAKPKDPALITGAPAASTCLQCHHPPHVERFDPVARMKDILGPGHGLPMK
jgi:2',3'-cyclic-nucleotide 2'-phosphodiesterase (5'-nucleotidase family)